MVALGVSTGASLIVVAVCMLPVGFLSLVSDRNVVRKDVEFSTFLRSSGGMATSSGTTLKQSLTKIDLSSFPALEDDIERLSKRLQARVEPDVCWRQFAVETGSALISRVVDVFYGAIKMGGDPERVGYLCSLFVAKATQLRAKRRLVSGTFSALATVMQAMVTILMVFVLAIVNNFVALVETFTTPEADAAVSSQPSLSLGLAQFSPGDLAFLALITALMVVGVSIASALAIMLSDGGTKLKVFLYLALAMFISGVSFIVIPPMVAGILKS
jgi:flagellar protein FlaJ